MKKEEILARCIDEVRSGKSTIADCVARYPELRRELTALLEIAAKVKADDTTPSPEFKLRAKRYLFEKMQEPSPKVSSRFSLWPKHALTRVLASVLVGLVVIGAAGGSVVYAAQSSLPGDTLYPVKTGVENLQLALTTNPVAKANLHLKLAQQRINEVTEQVKLDRHFDSQTLDTVKQQLNSAVSELSESKDTKAVDKILSRMSADTLNQQLELEQALTNVPASSQPVLQQAINEIRRGNTLAQIAYANKDYLRSRPSVNDNELSAGPFLVEGTILSIENRAWDIGGTVLQDVHYSGEYPTVGSYVSVQGVVKNGNIFITSVNVNQGTAESTIQSPTTVEGQYNGVDQNGTANISGLPVEINNNAQLQPGDKVRLQDEGISDKVRLKITSKESKQEQDQAGATLSGVLTAVDIPGNTITVNTTGNHITVNIGQSQFEDRGKGNGPSGLFALKNQVGHNIKLEGLYKKGNVLYARNVQINSD